jgi:hypothetical protein
MSDLQTAALALESEISGASLPSLVLINDGAELHIYTSGPQVELTGAIAGMLDLNPSMVDLFVDAMLMLKREGRDYHGLERVIISGERNN